MGGNAVATTPLNIHQYVGNSQLSADINKGGDTPFSKAPYLAGKASPLGVPSLSRILKEWHVKD